MNWLQVKYINLLSSKLKRFKKVNNQYNFRCPICGDSKKSETKARGWILSKSSKVIYHCFNCTITLSFKNFLRKVDQNLYDQFVVEQLKENQQHTKEFIETQEFVEKMKVPEFVKTTGLKKLKKISQLPHDHHVKQYIVDRQIPSNCHYKMYYCPNFKEWVNGLIPGKYKDISRDEERIIFPLLNEKKELIGIQGRSLRKNDDVKYMTIMLDEEAPKIFGLDEVDQNKTIFALEGPIDSFFLSNAVASCGGSIMSIIEQTDLPKNRIIIVYDNEPRSIHTIKKMEKAIDQGYSVVIWPSNINQKDINDMILSGLSKEYIENLILNNAYSGLEAKLKFTMWKLL